MGKIVLAAKVTHVPSLLISEQPGSEIAGTRDEAIASLKLIGQRADERNVDTYVIFDTHWLSNFGYHINGNSHHKGVFTSHEAPHMIEGLDYDLPGNPELADAISACAKTLELNALSHHIETLDLEYGTIVPMHYMNKNGAKKVVSIASPLFGSFEESKILGEATRNAIEKIDGNVALIASGSLSHRLWPNKNLGKEAWTTISSEFNRQVDLRVLELWQDRRYKEFLDMLPDYAVRCNGEGMMADTIMLFAALGWENYKGKAEQLCKYFPSSGSGQVNVEFHT